MILVRFMLTVFFIFQFSLINSLFSKFLLYFINIVSSHLLHS